MTEKPIGSKHELYLTLDEASDAARNLGFQDIYAYRAGCHIDPYLPKDPREEYKEEWRGWPRFLGFDHRPEPYGTLAEASAAAVKISASGFKEYQKKYKADPRLRALPNTIYPDWKGWKNYLGKPEKDFYPTLELASKAARYLGIRICAQYSEMYQLDPRLPSDPRQYYKDWSGWIDFLGSFQIRYSSLEKASDAARQLGITNSTEYKSRYKEDPKLPSNPSSYYQDEWLGWRSFLGKDPPVEKYKEFESAMRAARGLGIRTKTQYKSYLKKDPKLPWNPNEVYPDEWPGWEGFLGVPEVEPFYENLAEAKAAVARLNIRSWAEYAQRRHLDPRLPWDPRAKYPKKEWVGASAFFQVIRRHEEIYESMEEARAAVQKLPIYTGRSYSSFFRQDKRLPASPQKVYAREWKGWLYFLLPISYSCLSDLKRACKILKIKSAREYREKYRKHPPMPAHPERCFKGEWVSWFDLLGLTLFLGYGEACLFLASKGFKSKKDYIDFIESEGVDFLPRTPDQVYSDSWEGWHLYLGRPIPYTIDNIPSRYSEWGDAIFDFMKKARGGGSKKQRLCIFVRQFVQKNELGNSPVEFVLNGKCNARDFKLFLESEIPEKHHRQVWWAVNEFIEDIISTKLTIEDEVTGELVSVPGVRNPVSESRVIPEAIGRSLGESCKPALAYQYVDDMKNWMIPPGSKSFSDLKHLHSFDADWIEIDISRNPVDENDVDCVLKRSSGKLMIWSPVHWIQTYALSSIPARGVQIAYNDSGEGDRYIPEIVGDRLVWAENSSSLAGLTDAQGFVKRYPNDQFGMHFTTNKTGSLEKGYSVAWIPMSLAYWLVKLRRWQSKYNPVYRPLPWIECERTNLNEVQRKSKGGNFFLFRGFGREEPDIFNGRMRQRLAAALYHVQPEGLRLANRKGAPNLISRYRSDYTPHSMRVSLITAYIMEFGLPVEIVMKIAGHASVVVTIYYCKIGVEEFRSRFERAEKEALKNKAYAAQVMIEQGRIDELKSDLIATDRGIIESLSGDVPAGNYLFRDYGFCPYAGTRCDDGGPIAEKTQVRLPVPYGFLGCQNCLRCRHFVTGPAFVGGLVSLLNEISLNVRVQFEAYSALEEKVTAIRISIDKMDEEEYRAAGQGLAYDSGARSEFELRLRKLRSESESAAKKLDMFLCDMQAGARLLRQCDDLIGRQVEADNGEIRTQLIVQSGHELDIEFEEVSYFHQLCEVCSNAEIYESASSSLALATRSQMLDRMMSYNKIPVLFFSLSQRQQLVIGNQIMQLLVSRIKSWERIDGLVDGRLLFADLVDSERIDKVEIDLIFKAGRQSAEGVVYELGAGT
ncbi:gamma-mobile-trio integrase GmtZ [Pseudomonas panipatensis]|uniref:gamma-mobile-trio integrase GmtZ n=1 Tax=Pseudomonas panipatensis TaxID=428992 RepID=UPI0035B264BD